MKYLYSLIIALMLVITAKAQPQTRSVDYRLLGSQVFNTATNTPIGHYSLQSLEMPRGGRSKILVAIVTTGWGDIFLFTLTINAPTRTEWTTGPVMSLPGSYWTPLGTTCQTRQEDGGYWRLTFQTYLIGANNGNQKETPSQGASGPNEGAESESGYKMSQVQEITSTGIKPLVLKRGRRRHRFTRCDCVQNLGHVLQGFAGFGVAGSQLKLRD